MSAADACGVTHTGGPEAPYTLVWEQSAFWYLAGLEDGRRPGGRVVPFPDGPTTTAGREFIRAYVDACQDAAGVWPYLPDFYAKWKSQRSKASA